MKQLILSLLAIAAMACTSKPAETVLSGNVPVEQGNAVFVKIPDIQVDTVIEVADGSFSLTLPVDKTVSGIVIAGDGKAQFVPDGSALSLSWPAEEDGDLRVVSSSKKSVTSRLNALDDWMEEFFENYSTAEDQDAEFDKYVAKLKEVAKDNSDNVLGLMAVSSLRGQIEAPDMIKLIGSLAPQLQERPEIARMKGALDAAMQTLEGNLFTDFEITQPDGSIKKLSDYVGLGKYILVDFWASWCGPCRREIPNIKAVWEKYHGENFDVLSVAVWDKPEDTAKALEEEQLPWPQIVNAQRIPTDIYGIEGIPHLILFGPDGSIVKRGEGLRGANMDPVIGSYVK